MQARLQAVGRSTCTLWHVFLRAQRIKILRAACNEQIKTCLDGVVQSAVVNVELASGQVVERYDNVGMNCHGLVMWRGVFVLLSSKETSLITLNRSTKEVLSLIHI